MPPREKSQPTAEEIAAVVAWVAAGASFDATAPEDTAAPATAPLAQRTTAPPAFSRSLLEPLHRERVHAELIAPDVSGLWIQFAARSHTEDERVRELLAPVAPFVLDLSVAGTNARAETLALAGSMPQLERLDLSRTPCTSDDLAALAGHPALRSLVLTDTTVDDNAVATLLELPVLETVFVWNTALSQGSIATLEAERPRLRIVSGR